MTGTLALTSVKCSHDVSIVWVIRSYNFQATLYNSYLTLSWVYVGIIFLSAEACFLHLFASHSC